MKLKPTIAVAAVAALFLARPGGSRASRAT